MKNKQNCNDCVHYPCNNDKKRCSNFEHILDAAKKIIEQNQK